MNEKQARNEGLTYAGPAANVWDRKECEELKVEAAEIRKMGFRAVVVQSGANEWGGGSKLLYVDEDFMIYKFLKDEAKRSDGQMIIKAAEARCAEIMEDARRAQDALDASVADKRARLIKAGHADLEGVKPAVEVPMPKLVPMPCMLRDGIKCNMDVKHAHCAYRNPKSGVCMCVFGGQNA